MTGDDEDKKVENEDVGPGKSSSKDDDLKVNGVDGVGRGLQVHKLHHQGSGIGWESFLNVRSIKVLLVEYDDCTRLVVTALLRNCNYEVIEASNGLQAWKILENLTNHVDLILTEVVMPCVSGVTLLSKIMSHKTRKNVPVIMMSSHDSMGLVFKCLSKGAVDFLVKPIRKNELKNLWQHVWRRCASSSGSGSESGTQTQKSVKSRSSEKSENSSGRNKGDDNESKRLNVGDGSGSQSSWTKKPISLDSSRSLSPMDQGTECADSTCAQVIHSHGETSANKRAHMSFPKKCEENQKPENVAEGNGPVNLEAKPESLVKHIDRKQKLPPETEPGISRKRLEKGHESPLNKEFAASRELMNNRLSRKNDTFDNFKEPFIEPSLEQVRGVQDTGKGVPDDHNILRHSRYNSSSNAITTPNGITGSSCMIDNNNSLEVSRKDSTFNTKFNSNSNPSLNGVTSKLHSRPLIFQSEATSTINDIHPSSVFKTLEVPGPGPHPDLKIQHSHHSHHHHHHHHHSYHFHEHDESLLKKFAADSPHCRPSEEENISAQREAALTKFLQKRKERCYKKKVRYPNRKRVAESAYSA